MIQDYAPGFALESFDMIGGWRTRYRVMDEAQPAEEVLRKNCQPFAFRAEWHGTYRPNQLPYFSVTRNKLPSDLFLCVCLCALRVSAVKSQPQPDNQLSFNILH